MLVIIYLICITIWFSHGSNIAKILQKHNMCISCFLFSARRFLYEFESEKKFIYTYKNFCIFMYYNCQYNLSINQKLSSWILRLGFFSIISKNFFINYYILVKLFYYVIIINLFLYNYSCILLYYSY